MFHFSPTIVTGFSLKSVVGWLQIEAQYLTFVTFFYKDQGHGSVGKSVGTGPVSCGTERHRFEPLFLIQNQLALSLCTLVLKQVRPWRQCKIREKGLALKKNNFTKLTAYFLLSLLGKIPDVVILYCIQNVGRFSMKLPVIVDVLELPISSRARSLTVKRDSS